eukprot:1823019-Ditylum_brightwellii.AAC.1
MFEIGNKFFEEKTGKKKLQYAACTLQYYPVASDADEETKDGCVSILNEHFVNVNGIHSDMNEVNSDADDDLMYDDEDTAIKDGLYVFSRAMMD